MSSFRDTSALPPITVVGPGRVGGSIARAARTAGIGAELVGRRDPAAIAHAEVVLLCVPDAEIANVAAQVADMAPGLRLLGHVSGATGLGELEAATRADAFSLHPLQTVPHAETDLTGIPAAVSGSTHEALGLARALAQALGMKPFELPEGSRAAYHAAASLASNFLVTLEESAVGLLAAAGIEDGRPLLAPLVTSSAANWAERGGDALTGPIARGDERTVAAHTEAIGALAPELSPLYEVLAERTRALVSDREGLVA